jgi:hypothetical protein
MTPLSKSGAQADSRGTNLYRVAVVGAASLKGKEIAEILRERNFPAVDVRLLDDDESLGQLEAVGDEISFIQSIRSEQFERVDFTFFASDPRSTRNNWKAALDQGDTIVDLSYALEDEEGASVRSPWIERQTGQPIAPELQRFSRCLPYAARRPPKSSAWSRPCLSRRRRTARRGWTNCTSKP